MRASLARTQAWFFAQLQPGAKRGAGPVRARGPLSNRARVDLYADMYLARLTEALAAEFPRVRGALGERRFARLAKEYVARHPSRRPTIQHVGAQLRSHLARHPVRGAPYARELARLDQLTSEVYLAPGLGDEPLLTAADLRAVAPEAWPRLTFTVTPTLRVVKLAWSFPKGFPARGRPAHAPSIVRLWRRGLDGFEAPVGRGELAVLRAAVSGQPFGELCLAAGTAERAATLLATWLEEGLLLKAPSRRGPPEVRYGSGTPAPVGARSFRAGRDR